MNTGQKNLFPPYSFLCAQEDAFLDEDAGEKEIEVTAIRTLKPRARSLEITPKPLQQTLKTPQ